MYICVAGRQGTLVVGVTRGNVDLCNGSENVLMLDLFSDIPQENDKRTTLRVAIQLKDRYVHILVPRAYLF